MKEISMTTKFKAVKMFLSGLSYDEIATQLGIAKGSVVNIITEFREGMLPAPPGMTEYIDGLRQVAVDLKKHSTSVAQLKSYLKLHVKLQEMGVEPDSVQQWLDICHDIASPTVSNAEFVQSALELAEATSKIGLSYKSVLQDYTQKSKQLQALDNQIQQKNEELSKLRSEIKEEKEKATSMLDSINGAIATAQDNLKKQKEDMKSQLDQYLSQNQLSWKKVNTVLATLNTELGKGGFSQEEMDDLSNQIVNAGSLYSAAKQLEHQREELQSDVNHLTKEKDSLESSVNKLGNVHQKIFNSILEKGLERDELDALIKSKKSELLELNTMISNNINDIRTAFLIINFLIAPHAITEHDIDTLARWMIAIRQKRLGIGLNQVKGSNGKIIYKCELPTIYSNVADEWNLNVDAVREKLALCLMPLVKDKFVSKIEYDAAQFSQAMSEINKKLLALELKNAGSPAPTSKSD